MNEFAYSLQYLDPTFKRETIPKEIGQKFSTLGAGVAGQVGQKSDGLLAAQAIDKLAVDGYFQRAQQIELECLSHCAVLGL